MNVYNAGATILWLFGTATLADAQSLTFERGDAAATTTPRSVVTADFNRDGRPDLALCGTGRKSVAVLLNHGGGIPAFSLASETIVGGGPFELAAADLNRDGKPDLVVANADANAVDILLGAGDGTFPTRSRVDIAGGGPRGLTVADSDRDGVPDIIVTEYLTGAWRILYGSGSGSIRSQSRFGGVANPQGVVAADFNHDGRLDIAMASAGINAVAIFYSTSTGGIVQKNVTVGAAVNVLAYGDYDHDGWLDLFAASTASNAVYSLRGGPSGLTWKATTATGSSPRGLEAADLNQDGHIDLITGDRVANTVTVLVGRSDGTGPFDPITVTAGQGSRDVAIADFDHDGRLDIATANEFGNSTTVLANHTALVAPAFAFDRALNDNMAFARVQGVADFNENGKPDLILEYSLLLDDVTRIGAPFGQNATPMAAGDFNRDGHADVAASSSGSIWILFGDGAGGFTSGPKSSPALGVPLISADVNRDGREDLVTAASSSGRLDLRVVLGQGDGTFVPSAPVSVTGFRMLRMGDVNRDGRLDLIASSTAVFTVWLGDGTGTFGAAQTFDAGLEIAAFDVGDLNHDGILDVAASNDGPDRTFVTVYLGHGDGTFGGGTDFASTRNPATNWTGNGLSIADLNNDGNLDVLIGIGGLLPGAGDGTLGEPLEFDFFAWGPPVVADYNGDGLLDVLTGGAAWSGVALNRRTTENRAPVVKIAPEVAERNYADFFDFDDQWEIGAWDSFDPDAHALIFDWRAEGGQYLGAGSSAYPNLGSGVHQLTLTASDGRGLSTVGHATVTITPHKETVYYASEAMTFGNWRKVDDATAAIGVRMWNPNANLPKVTTPLANPTNYIEFPILADATQTYKLWIRMKAEGNGTGNDSVWVQIAGAVAGGQAIEPGTTSALAVNLEECSGCGLSGWGWEDDGWGAVNTNGTTIRFAESGVKWVRIQTREDGVSIDQIVLSSERYLTARPGAAKNDTTSLDFAGPWLGCWDRCQWE